ncbi:polysaccharide biosynthesis/export protein [SAR86 cluster bacterium SAR86E]|uniref:Polysaccharide biosynthesis/export protein n=1 Tax=SAR86 cluster bacterium SAR86E TaxID=1208365 RepID=K6GGK6_9GAMM|nr:polysaccharide biosynthesis/export protein [SAR86 cluster bacterium SAR86E]
MKYINLILPKKTSLLFLSLMVSGLTFGQEINKDFLNSLPKSIQEDFLDTDSDETLEDNYNERPETRIQKIESGIDGIKDQLRSMEAQINRVEDPNDMKVFGTNFFDSYQTSFSPINQKNFSADYVVDVGDILSIQTLGNISIDKKIPVSRDGSINIPEIGIISVAGMPFEDVIETIEEYVAKKFIGLEVFVNLDLARDMSILLVGNAENPGIYTLPGGSNILSLLHAAGGIAEGGSYRSIIHKRNNKIVQELDLYDILIDGDLLFSSPLRSGDSVIVGPAKRMVLISGGINFPASYELKDDEKFIDLVNLAQGYSLSATNDVLIVRASGEETLRFSKDESLDLELNHGDSIKIPLFSPITQKTFTVKLEGAIKKPGLYSFANGETLHDLIDQAGGYVETSYPYGGILYRKKVAEMQEETFNKTYNELINFLAANSGSSGSIGISNSQNLQIILAELKASKFKGRLSAEFSKRKVAQDPSLDTVLADGDEIYIPYFTSDVFVSGDVLNPGGRRYSSDLKLSDYINQSGGLGRFADEDRIVVIKPDGDAEVLKAKLFFAGSDPEISPGTTIFVPREIGKLEGIAFTATLAPIVSSLALSLASLNSIN